MTMRDMGSVKRGLKVMTCPWWHHCFFIVRRTKFFAHWWTPIWHKGRGPYVTIGLGIVHFGRGY